MPRARAGVSQAHYTQSIEPDDELSELFKDVFLYHWKEESQHAVMDELEWRREHARLTAAERDTGVDDLIVLVGAVDGVLQAQAAADTEYFLANADRPFAAAEQETLAAALLKAYRWQYIVSGVQHPRFAKILGELVTEAQTARIGSALAPIM